MRVKTKFVIKATDYNQLMVNSDSTIESINDASFLFASAIYREMDKIGIRPSYRTIMQSLYENESLTQLELVNITNLKAPTISITLRAMEHEGIVLREKSDNDRRETHVSITEKGREMYNTLLSSITELQTKMLEGITNSEQAVLISLLDKICDNLRND